MSNIEIQFPAWYIVLCVLVGLVFAALLYYRALNFPSANNWLKSGLATLRFLAVTVLSLLLLSPVLKYNKEESKKPIVVFAQDASSSIKSEWDSAALINYQSDLQQVIADLGDEYEVKQLAFGESLRDTLDFSFRDKTSNQSSVLEYVGDLYGDQNLGAVVYATDGIYNEGKDPRYANLHFTAPIYTVAMGDTTPDRDLIVKQIFHNNIAYLGDQTSVQVDITGYNCEGVQSTLSFFRVDPQGNQLLVSKPIVIDNSDYFTTVEVSIPQDYIGLQRYRVALSAQSGERSLSNNRKDFFIDVVDARQKILILAASPHPDISALRNSLEKNKNYDVESALLKNYDQSIFDYDFVVLHQLPSRKFPAVNIIRSLNEKSIPRMIVVGAQTNIAALNQMQSLISIKLKTATSNEVQAIYNRAFSFFNISHNLSQEISEFPPLNAPFGEYSLGAGTEVFLKQRVGSVDTDFPLLLIGEEAGSRQAILCAEGIWKWKLFDYLQREHTDLVDELIANTIQYVTLREDKRRFRVFQNKNLWAENEETLFNAELYNQSYQLINEPEVTFTVLNRNGDVFNFAFSKRNDGYSLNAGKLPVDDYTWTANTQYEGQQYSAQGQFSVQAIEKESYESVANHQILSYLSENSSGQMIYPAQVSQLSSMLRENSDLKPVFYQILQTRSAIHLKWLFFLLLGFLVLEWALRRFLGTY